VSVLFSALMFSALLLLPAWTWRWERAWVVLGVVVVGTVITMLVAFRDNEGLYQERKRGLFQKDQPLADKLVLAPFALSFYGQLVCIPLDVFRWHLLPPPGEIVSGLGLLMFIGGWALMTLAFRANAFAAPVVKHQKDRQHRVVDTGAYAVVRHPMYTGVVLLLPGLALWLESTAAALFALVPITLLMVRVFVEEDFLRRELPGYVDYVQRVRWRLVPGIW
jgi:protein-S-isoprenylcysteine O-methyltransferase Ste14